MDKQTLSNYGWLVIVTLILAVMLAFATPFGNYVGDAVVSVANGFVGASNEAIDEDNIAINEDKWDSKFDYSGFDKQLGAGATFTDGTFLTWEELKLEENGQKYNYDATGISDYSIAAEAFWNCQTIKSFTLPDTVTVVDYGAFANCDSLTTVNLGHSVTEVAFEAFSQCDSLVDVYMPKTVASIGDYCFNAGYTADGYQIILHYEGSKEDAIQHGIGDYFEIAGCMENYFKEIRYNSKF